MEEELYLASKFTTNDILDLVCPSRYINATIALRHDTSGPNSYSSFSRGPKGSLFTSNYLTTIGVLSGCYLSIENYFNTLTI